MPMVQIRVNTTEETTYEFRIFAFLDGNQDINATSDKI